MRRAVRKLWGSECGGWAVGEGFDVGWWRGGLACAVRFGLFLVVLLWGGVGWGHIDVGGEWEVGVRVE